MSLSTLERILLLKGSELFSQIASEDLVPVADIAHEMRFGAGETFIRQGEQGDCVYLVVEGQVSVRMAGVGQVSVRQAGASLGEMAILSGQPRAADCVALTDLVVLRIDREDFWDLLGEHSPLALGVIRALLTNLDDLMARLRGGGAQ
jgi:CRP-like cAMP-binding protein